MRDPLGSVATNPKTLAEPIGPLKGGLALYHTWGSWNEYWSNSRTVTALAAATAGQALLMHEIGPGELSSLLVQYAAAEYCAK